MKKNKQQLLDKAFFEAAKKGDLEDVQRLLEKGANPRDDNSSGLWVAAEMGFIGIVRLLIPISDVDVQFSAPLTSAVRGGHLEIVKLLAPISNAKHPSCSALLAAVEEGNAEMVRVLIPYSEPQDQDSIILYLAAMTEKMDCVEELLEFSSISEWQNIKDEEGDDRWYYVKSDVRVFLESWYERERLRENLPSVAEGLESQDEKARRGGRL